MVELFEDELTDDGRKSSKGNQLKWKRDGIWYKADYTGYEGLSEYLISHLLLKSSLNREEFLLYEPERIQYKSSIFNGVKSKDMLSDDWQIITLERLFLNTYGRGLNAMIYAEQDVKKRLPLIVAQTERLTGLKDFGIYMEKMLCIDAFFLNEDRHTHNIAVLTDSSGHFDFCRIFDQGAGLLSDTILDYPLDKDIYECIDSAKPKTFCADFDEQLDIAEETYGSRIRFFFSRKEVDELLDAIPEEMYDREIIERVRSVVYERMRKYQYLFSEEMTAVKKK
ncbi:MAG: hypothetical protein IJJ13_07635 [Lachnospiraceae bacterium]|nr:hypothetical protein [Lachnospiraceae bacterium]